MMFKVLCLCADFEIPICNIQWRLEADRSETMKIHEELQLGGGQSSWNVANWRHCHGDGRRWHHILPCSVLGQPLANDGDLGCTLSAILSPPLLQICRSRYCSLQCTDAHLWTAVTLVQIIAHVSSKHSVWSTSLLQFNICSFFSLTKSFAVPSQWWSFALVVLCAGGPLHCNL